MASACSLVVCYFPQKAYRSQERNPETGRYGITFNATKALIEGSSITIPCGVCMGCRLEKSRQWGLRCTHEAQLYDENAFLTLTFDDKYLPADYSVNVRDLQLFVKKLRKSLGSKKVRFYAGAEYGEENLRPHYHLILFNHDFADKKLYSENNGKRLYTSDKLTNLWGFGHCTTGTVTFESASYVARYCTKKISGKKAAAHYTRLHPLTHKLVNVRPEFSVMSRRPGIGAPWLERYRSDVWPSGFIVHDGRRMQPPRFYEQALSEEELTALKRLRAAEQVKQKWNHSRERLAVRFEVKQSRIKLLKRTL